MARPDSPIDLPSVVDRDRYAFIEDAVDNGVNRRVWVRGGTVSTNAGATPTIFNLATPLANTEYSQAIPSGTTKLLIRARSTAQLQFAFSVGDSSTNFITIPRGTSYSSDNLLLSGVTLYIQSSLAGNVIEVLTWA